jgi:hypothetical protein
MTGKSQIRDIDHILTKVDDANDAGRWFERLGFTVTPLSTIESMGLCNRLVLFASRTPGTANFIELMAPAPGGVQNGSMRRLLEGADGTRSMVLAVGDAHAARAELVGKGHEAGEVHHIERQWSLPTEVLDLAFDVLLPIAAPFTFNLCRYYTLQHYVRQSWTHHANGTTGLRAVYCVAQEAQAAARFYAELFSCEVRGSEADGWRVSPANVDLVVFTPSAWRQHFGCDAERPGFQGYCLHTADLTHTLAAVEQAGAQWTRLADGSALLAPGLMFGNAVHLSPENGGW